MWTYGKVNSHYKMVSWAKRKEHIFVNLIAVYCDFIMQFNLILYLAIMEVCGAVILFILYNFLIIKHTFLLLTWTWEGITFMHSSTGSKRLPAHMQPSVKKTQ